MGHNKSELLLLKKFSACGSHKSYNAMMGFDTGPFSASVGWGIGGVLFLISGGVMRVETGAWLNLLDLVKWSRLVKPDKKLQLDKF